MDKGNKPNRLLWILGGAAVAAFLIILGLYIAYFKNLSVTNDSATWGTFGDYLGGTLNPIISFLALIGLLYTIHQQAQEMQATREELKQAAEQQRKQVEQQSRQSEIFNLQQFESTFFSLLEQHNKIIENLIEAKISDLTNITIDEKFNIDCYVKDNIRQNPLPKQYFIILFQILKFISLSLSKDIEGKTDNKITINDFSHDNQQSREKLSNHYINPQEKIYSNILRSFIPNDILKLLILNCLSLDKDSKEHNLKTFYNFQGLLNRYQFLEHLHLTIPTINNYYDNYDFIYFYLILTKTTNCIRESLGKSNLSNEITSFNISKDNFIKAINEEKKRLESDIQHENGFDSHRAQFNPNSSSYTSNNILYEKLKILEKHIRLLQN
ncbi:putative phage abortive infection protein [Neisseria sp. Marseille-Q2251]|uniref:putative phage abortive infection protein n=1 Tax=Neisseria sp. Marseille-Q2251 TaxID=2866585 RepID=UPI003139360C